MTNQHKLDKFILRIEDFIAELKAKNSIQVHAQIDQFFYMQKLEELKLLIEKIKEGSKRLKALDENMEGARKEIFFAWKRDARWLNKHKAEVKLPASEISSN